MRIYPIAVEVERTPTQDDILPLTKPVIGTSGKVYTELSIPKETVVTVSVTGYNLYVFSVKLPPHPRPSVHTITFVAETRMCGVRTLVSSDRSVGSKRVRRRNHLLEYMGTCAVSRTAVGTLSTDLSSHSSTFSGGPRSCIGWRFACVDRLVQSPKDTEECPFDSIIEMQAFLVTLIRRFDISLTDKQPQIRRAGSGVLVPSVRGEEQKGSQLPLKITAIGNE